MTYFIRSFFIFLAFGMNAQSESLPSQQKLDSIVQEADKLYAYEWAAWQATDLLMQQNHLKEQYGGYLVYEKNDSIYVSFLENNQEKVMAQYGFSSAAGQGKPSFNEELRTLSKTELNLWNIKNKILNQIFTQHKDITIPEGCSPNLVLLEGEAQYRLYLILGTSQENRIPLGNDYLFVADQEGKISHWRKFHNTFIPIDIPKTDEQKISSAMHSHVKTTPYITATDICTFRLYAPLYGLDHFKVYSSALKTVFEYRLSDNRILITDL